MATHHLISVDATVLWRVEETSNPYRVIAVCDELNLAVEGGSVEDLNSLIREAIDTLFLDLFMDDEFDSYLHARGWSVAGEIPMRTDATAEEVDDIKFEVPFELIAAGPSGSERRTIQ